MIRFDDVPASGDVSVTASIVHNRNTSHPF